jgi:hypothetical protein
MSPDLTIHSPLSVADVLDRLRARGREWKESTVPPALRENGVLHIDVDIDGNRFTLSASARAARAYVGWTGTVTQADGQPGSRLLLRRYTIGCTPLVIGGIVVVATAFELYSSATWPEIAFTAGVITVAGAIGYAVQEMMTRDVRNRLFALLLVTVDADRYTRVPQ